MTAEICVGVNAGDAVVSYDGNFALEWESYYAKTWNNTDSERKVCTDIDVYNRRTGEKITTISAVENAKRNVAIARSTYSIDYYLREHRRVYESVPYSSSIVWSSGYLHVDRAE